MRPNELPFVVLRSRAHFEEKFVWTHNASCSLIYTRDAKRSDHLRDGCIRLASLHVASVFHW